MKPMAFCKFAGLANGGTEKYLQTIALLFKEKLTNIDYYYTNAAPIANTEWVHPDNSQDRIDLLINNDIKLIKIHVQQRHDNNWVNNNFFEKFNEHNYDIMITAGDGRPEFPYTQLNNIKIIHTIHGTHVHNKTNIIKSVLLCKWQADNWLNNGGDKNKLEIIPPIVRVPSDWSCDFRNLHNIPEDAFVYGLHQSNGVGSLVSLQAFSNIVDNNIYYIILGGSDIHRQYVNDNNIKNVIFLEATTSIDQIHSFLDAIDVYAHCRVDGEVCSACIIEAMAHNKPIITFIGDGTNLGHLEQVDGCGKVAYSTDEYINEMVKLQNKHYYEDMSGKVETKYKNAYDFRIVENKLLQLI